MQCAILYSVNQIKKPHKVEKAKSPDKSERTVTLPETLETVPSASDTFSSKTALHTSGRVYSPLCAALKKQKLPAVSAS